MQRLFCWLCCLLPLWAGAQAYRTVDTVATLPFPIDADDRLALSVDLGGRSATLTALGYEPTLTLCRMTVGGAATSAQVRLPAWHGKALTRNTAEVLEQVASGERLTCLMKLPGGQLGFLLMQTNTGEITLQGLPKWRGEEVLNTFVRQDQLWVVTRVRRAEETIVVRRWDANLQLDSLEFGIQPLISETVFSTSATRITPFTLMYQGHDNGAFAASWKNKIYPDHPLGVIITFDKLGVTTALFIDAEKMAFVNRGYPHPSPPQEYLGRTPGFRNNSYMYGNRLLQVASAEKGVLVTVTDLFQGTQTQPAKVPMKTIWSNPAVQAYPHTADSMVIRCNDVKHLNMGEMSFWGLAPDTRFYMMQELMVLVDGNLHQTAGRAPQAARFGRERLINYFGKTITDNARTWPQLTTAAIHRGEVWYFYRRANGKTAYLVRFRG